MMIEPLADPQHCPAKACTSDLQVQDYGPPSTADVVVVSSWFVQRRLLVAEVNLCDDHRRALPPSTSSADGKQRKQSGARFVRINQASPWSAANESGTNGSILWGV